jgi:hypothetical protein
MVTATRNQVSGTNGTDLVSTPKNEFTAKTQRLELFFHKGRSDQVCHSRESGNPVYPESVGYWISAFAGITCSDGPYVSSRSLRLCGEIAINDRTQSNTSAGTMESFTKAVNQNGVEWFTNNAVARRPAVPSPLPALWCSACC